MLVDLGNFYDGSEQDGAHAWYRRIPQTDIGVKVFRPNRKSAWEARDEYAITCYLQYSGITSVPLAFGKVALRGQRGASRFLWGMWMEHIEGITAQMFVDQIIKLRLPERMRTSSKAERESWAYGSLDFVHVRHQIERHCNTIKNIYGIDLCDADNLSNFIITPNGFVRCIDFSSESLHDDKMNEIKVLTLDAQSITIPQTKHLDTLRNLGYIP